MRRSGVVVEIGPKNQVIVLTSQGEFVKVPFKKHVQVGQEIRFSPKKERLSAWQLGLAATLFLALVGTWPLLSEQLVPTSIVPAFILTVDINPSLEMQISADQKVLAVEGLNRDGKNLLANLAVVGDNLGPALEKITAQAEKMGYMRQGQNEVVVTIASQRNQNAKPLELKGGGSSGEYAALEKVIMEAFGSSRLAQVRVWQVPRSLQTEAKLAGIVPSRYLAIQLPASPVIPQRFETRLTMSDTPEVEVAAKPLTKTSTLQASAQQRPSLTPSQWTKQTMDAINRTELYNANFSLTAVKGDL